MIVTVCGHGVPHGVLAAGMSGQLIIPVPVTVAWKQGVVGEGGTQPVVEIVWSCAAISSSNGKMRRRRETGQATYSSSAAFLACRTRPRDCDGTIEADAAGYDGRLDEDALRYGANASESWTEGYGACCRRRLAVGAAWGDVCACLGDYGAVPEISDRSALI